MTYTCPVCREQAEEELYGPCSPCRDRLRQWAAERGEIVLKKLEELKDKDGTEEPEEDPWMEDGSLIEPGSPD